MVKLPVRMEPLSMPPMSQRCPSFVYQVYAASIKSPFTFMLLFKGSWNLSRLFLSCLDFACQPFPVLLLVHAHLVWVLPHYTTLLSTSCWLMGDALMPSFQRIPSHQRQIIYSRIGVYTHLSALRLTVISGRFPCHRQFWEYINVPWSMDSFKCSTSTHLFTFVCFHFVPWFPFSLSMGYLTSINSICINAK